jgi:rhamnulokinase
VTVLAVDLGASSVRVVAVHYDGHRLEVTERHRVSTPYYQLDGYERWDIEAMIAGIESCLSACNDYQSVGVDGWGVDFVLLDQANRLVAPPIRYRDVSHKVGADALSSRGDAYRLFIETGIQPHVFNTAAQLLARKLRDDHEIHSACCLALIPDYVSSELCNPREPVTCEETNASTTQLMSLGGGWSKMALEATEVPPAFMPEIRARGSVIGERSNGGPVIRVASHDTASAVLGACLKDDEAFISSGTWSLVGILCETPLTSKEAFLGGFSNEFLGPGYRFLKNVMGLWLLQRASSGKPLNECLTLATHARPFVARFDVNDSRLLNPPDMVQAISEVAKFSFQDEGELYRCILENLAAAYANTLSDLCKVTGRSFRRLRVVGGGSQNRLLNQMTADASGLEVVSGPMEATAMGNALVQLTTLGVLNFPVESYGELAVFEPKNSAEWSDWLFKNEL